jgi:hypothetical protein
LEEEEEDEDEDEEEEEGWEGEGGGGRIEGVEGGRRSRRSRRKGGGSDLALPVRRQRRAPWRRRRRPSAGPRGCARAFEPVEARLGGRGRDLDLE